MKYFLMKIKKLPIDVIDLINSYLPTIKLEKKRIWYSRLISPDFNYYDKSNMIYCLNREKILLDILIYQKAYHIIDNIHKNNLKIL